MPGPPALRIERRSAQRRAPGVVPSTPARKHQHRGSLPNSSCALTVQVGSEPGEDRLLSAVARDSDSEGRKSPGGYFRGRPRYEGKETGGEEEKLPFSCSFPPNPPPCSFQEWPFSQHPHPETQEATAEELPEKF